MKQTNERDFVAMAFQKCVERGWINELVASTISTQDIAAFETEHKMCLPSLYKAFLTAYQLPKDMFQMCGIANDMDETSPLWLILYGITNMNELSRHIKCFRKDVEEFREGTAKSCSNLIPIGDWCAGAGPLCIDLTRSDESVKEYDESTCSLV